MSQPLTCPKCRSEMHSYERNRVLVDQCTGCGGIFLDKGELESLAAAENAWHSGAAAPGAAASPGAGPAAGVPQQQSYAQGYPPARSYATSNSRYVQQYPQAQRYASSRDRYGSGYGYKRKSKGSFLGDLFG